MNGIILFVTQQLATYGFNKGLDKILQKLEKQKINRTVNSKENNMNVDGWFRASRFQSGGSLVPCPPSGWPPMAGGESSSSHTN